MTLLLIGGIFFLSGLVQGLTGFGSALIAIPLLTLIIDIKFAIPLSVLSSVLLTSFLCLQLKAHFDKEVLLPLCLSTLPGIVVGVSLLKKIPSSTVALLLGLLLIAYALYNLAFSPGRRELHHFWAYIAGFCSGAIGSAFSAGGPPVIIYTTLTGWSKNNIKATLTFFFFFNSAMVALAHWFTGLTTMAVLRTFAITAPCVLAGTILGSLFYGYLHKDSYLRFIFIFLLLMGVIMIITRA